MDTNNTNDFAKMQIKQIKDEVQRQLDNVSNEHVESRPIPTLEAYSVEIANFAKTLDRADVAEDAAEIIQKVKDTYDQAVRDLELLADFLNHEFELKRMAEGGQPNSGDIKVGGYILFLIVGKKDGTKVVVNRTIKPEHKDAVESYFSGKSNEVSEEELEEFEKYLSTL